MPRFPVDAPLEKVVSSPEALGFEVMRRGSHVSLARVNPDGTRSTLTLPGQRTLKGSTLRTAISLARIPREDFIREYGRT